MSVWLWQGLCTIALPLLSRATFARLAVAAQENFRKDFQRAAEHLVEPAVLRHIGWVKNRSGKASERLCHGKRGAGTIGAPRRHLAAAAALWPIAE